jgi:hypothetical protein
MKKFWDYMEIINESKIGGEKYTFLPLWAQGKKFEEKTISDQKVEDSLTELFPAPSWRNFTKTQLIKELNGVFSNDNSKLITNKVYQKGLLKPYLYEKDVEYSKNFTASEEGEEDAKNWLWGFRMVVQTYDEDDNLDTDYIDSLSELKKKYKKIEKLSSNDKDNLFVYKGMEYAKNKWKRF